MLDNGGISSSVDRFSGGNPDHTEASRAQGSQVGAGRGASAVMCSRFSSHPLFAPVIPPSNDYEYGVGAESRQPRTSLASCNSQPGIAWQFRRPTTFVLPSATLYGLVVVMRCVRGSPLGISPDYRDGGAFEGEESYMRWPEMAGSCGLRRNCQATETTPATSPGVIEAQRR